MLGPTKTSDGHIFDTCMLGEKHVRTCRRAFLAIKTLRREYPDRQCKRILVYASPPQKSAPSRCSLMYTLNYIPASTQYDACGVKKWAGLSGGSETKKEEGVVCLQPPCKAARQGSSSWYKSPPPPPSSKATDPLWLQFQLRLCKHECV